MPPSRRNAVDLGPCRSSHHHSTRADLLRRLGRTGEARAAYGRALELVHAEPERRFLERRRAALARGAKPS